MTREEDIYTPHTQSVKRSYVRGVDSTVGDLVTRKEALAEFNRWYSEELDIARQEGIEEGKRRRDTELLADAEAQAAREEIKARFDRVGAVVSIVGGKVTYTRNLDGSWYGRYDETGLHDNPWLPRESFDGMLMEDILTDVGTLS